MNSVCNENECNGCMACAAVCPKQCIEVVDEVFFLNALKDDEKCISCGLCEKVCPNINQVIKHKIIQYKQGWTKSEIRKKSASGGVAAAIMESFIRDGGYVSACLYRDGEFVFDITNKIEDARLFLGSKYVKSNPKDAYIKVKERLKTNKVLFIGLPCQVAGINNFIQNKDNLFTIDLICHGTPSPKILEKYLNEKGIDMHECKDIQFRSKTEFGLRINDRVLISEGIDDYLLAFMGAVDYTENCYSCHFACSERISDITLGDSWGTNLIEEEKDGVSLLLIQTSKGNELIKKADLELYDVDLQKAIEANHQLQHPSRKTHGRDIFMKYILQGATFSKATFKVYRKKIIKRYIKKVIHKIKSI